MAKEKIVEGIDQCVKNYCDRHGLDEVVMCAWKCKVLEEVDARILQLESGLRFGPLSETLEDANCSRYLSLLHKNFVLAPIDKATGKTGYAGRISAGNSSNNFYKWKAFKF